MADKLSENSGIDTGKVTAEQLVEAMKLVGNFANKDPEGALRIVQASISANSGRGNSNDRPGGSTSPGTSSGNSVPSVPSDGAQF